MRFRSTLTANISLLGLAPLAASFLIPPEIKSSINRDPFGLSPSFDVECVHCPRLTHDRLGREVLVTEKDSNHSIHLGFTAKNRKVFVNGCPIFPPRLLSKDTLPTAHILTSDGVESGAHPMLVGVAGQLALGSNGVDTTWKAMDFTIHSIADFDVETPVVHLDIIDDGEEFFIVNALTRPARKLSEAAEMCEDAASPRLCRARAALSQRMRAIIEDARQRASTMERWAKQHSPGSKSRPCHRVSLRPSKGRIGVMRDGERHHHRRARIVRLLHIVMRTVLIPAALGITCGMFASFVGMLVGRLIVFVWTRLIRGGQRGNVQNIRIVEVEIEKGEKTGLMEHVEEAPPAYRDEVDVKVDSKN